MVELGMIIFFHWKYDWNMLNIGSAQSIDFRGTCLLFGLRQCSPRAHQLAAQTSPGPCTPSPAQARPGQIHNQLAQAQPGPLINWFKRKNTTIFLTLKQRTVLSSFYLNVVWIYRIIGMNLRWFMTFTIQMGPATYPNDLKFLSPGLSGARWYLQIVGPAQAHAQPGQWAHGPARPVTNTGLRPVLVEYKVEKGYRTTVRSCWQPSRSCGNF